VWAMQVGGAIKGWLICAQKPRSERISCIGQGVASPTTKDEAVESRIGPTRGFGITPGELFTINEPNPYPKSEKPPARK